MNQHSHRGTTTTFAPAIATNVNLREGDKMDRMEQAAEGLRLLEEAIVAELNDHPKGLYNSEIARALKIESDHQGRHGNYLTYSVLGGLLKAGRVVIEKRDNRNYYIVVPIP